MIKRGLGIALFLLLAGCGAGNTGSGPIPPLASGQEPGSAVLWRQVDSLLSCEDPLRCAGSPGFAIQSDASLSEGAALHPARLSEAEFLRLNGAINAVLPTIAEPLRCERDGAESLSEKVELEIEGHERSSIVQTDRRMRTLCYRGGRGPALALRDLLRELRRTYSAPAQD